MKILLINSPVRLCAAPNSIPSGLTTIAATLRDAGLEVEIYDMNALRPSREACLSELARREWDIAGVSGLITTYPFQQWLIGELKQIRPAAPVVSGGGLATSSTDLLFSRTPVDFTVRGEGEQTMLELCRAIASGASCQNVAGIACRGPDGPVYTAHRANIEDLDTIPFPAWDLLPMEIYLANPVWGQSANNSSGFPAGVAAARSMNVISSRGCPCSCHYCFHLFGRGRYRFRSAQNVIAEIEALVSRYCVDFIGFVDDNMMASRTRMTAFCELMEERRLPVTWGCHGRVGSADSELLNRMARAGCVWIGYGIESGSQRILDRMNKKVTVSRIRTAIENTRAAGIYANTTFIFGYPGETLESIQETIELKKDLGIHCGSFFATPYPGTQLYEEVSGGITDIEGYVRSLGDAVDFSINLTDFDDPALWALKDKMDRNIDVL